MAQGQLLFTAVQPVACAHTLTAQRLAIGLRYGAACAGPSPIVAGPGGRRGRGDRVPEGSALAAPRALCMAGRRGCRRGPVPCAAAAPVPGRRVSPPMAAPHEQQLSSGGRRGEVGMGEGLLGREAVEGVPLEEAPCEVEEGLGRRKGRERVALPHGAQEGLPALLGAPRGPRPPARALLRPGPGTRRPVRLPVDPHAEPRVGEGRSALHRLWLPPQCEADDGPRAPVGPEHVRGAQQQLE
eukprot:CAMPEP_0206009704 /NCGR_PEP_ID=MMETSP1464-20131121/10191_1 /ASSEMBLY_ACC=CAM_ASM_001124 /TAXON_ID=119497 /ORGANISM="Exanthemachrysis gayraliae, Strain RCC1523" /LENGTH=240 /DNA_ID=CAMNT_0053383307 /DNA_START=40 /DNA_END=763 /DNA_ORIENTATION=+